METAKIEFETRQRLLGLFTAIGERLFKHSEHMRSAGYSAWVPLFEDSVAGCNVDNLEFHKEFLIEAAKEEIGNGEGGGIVLWGGGRGYKSPLLSELRRERDAAGFGWDYFKGSNRDTWQCWLSPCWKERWRIRAQEPERLAQLLAIRNARLKEERVKQVERLCQVEWSSSTKHQTKERRAVAKRILGEALGEFGYRPRPDLSIPGWIVHSRPIADQWELRFGIAISSSTLYEHIFACKTSLRKELLVWPTLYDPSEYVEVLLENTALEFGRTYHSFNNSQEFEINLRAILFLYGLEHEFIIRIISENI
jgi:hypothetical protein